MNTAIMTVKQARKIAVGIRTLLAKDNLLWLGHRSPWLLKQLTNKRGFCQGYATIPINDREHSQP